MDEKNWKDLMEACNIPKGIEPPKVPEFRVKMHYALPKFFQEVFESIKPPKPKSEFQLELHDLREEC